MGDGKPRRDVTWDVCKDDGKRLKGVEKGALRSAGVGK